MNTTNKWFVKKFINIPKIIKKATPNLRQFEQLCSYVSATDSEKKYLNVRYTLLLSASTLFDHAIQTVAAKNNLRPSDDDMSELSSALGDIADQIKSVDPKERRQQVKQIANLILQTCTLLVNIDLHYPEQVSDLMLELEKAGETKPLVSPLTELIISYLEKKYGDQDSLDPELQEYAEWHQFEIECKDILRHIDPNSLLQFIAKHNIC